MRRLGHENPTRKTGSTGSNQVTFGRKGIFAQRLGRFSAVATFLPTKGARARSEHAQRNYQGRFSDIGRYGTIVFSPFSNSFFGKNLRVYIVADDGHGGNRYRSTLRTKYRSLATLSGGVLRA